MNIYAERGSKVFYCYINAGHEYEAEAAKLLMTPGAVYTIESTDVDSSSTAILLQEFPGKEFNSCLFEDVDRAQKCTCGGFLVRSRPLSDEMFECSSCGKEHFVAFGGENEAFANWIKDNEARTRKP